MSSFNFSKKITSNTLALVVSSSLLVVGAVAHAGYISTDEENGASISSKTSSGGNFNLANQNKSRAEFRYKSINNGTVSLSGTMKIQSWNKASESGTDSDRICIIQALNMSADNQTSGSSNPISQLTIRKKPTSSDRNRMVFYVIYGDGGAECTGAPIAKEGSSYNISMTVAKGGSPAFKINGTSCQKSPADGDRAGRVGNSDTGKYYYGKLGAYVTGGDSNQYGASGNGVTIKWSSIHSY